MVAGKQTACGGPFILAVMLLCLLSSCMLLSGCRLIPDKAAPDIDLVRVRVTGVVDGDTIYVRFSSGLEEKVRLIGVDAPEIDHPTRGKEPFGAESAEFTVSMLDNAVAWLEFDEGERDQFGRMLAYLWLEKPQEISEAELRDKLFNARLLIGGYAGQVIFEPNVKYVDYFTAFAAEARRAERGMWAPQ